MSSCLENVLKLHLIFTVICLIHMMKLSLTGDKLWNSLFTFCSLIGHWYPHLFLQLHFMQNFHGIDYVHKLYSRIGFWPHYIMMLPFLLLFVMSFPFSLLKGNGILLGLLFPVINYCFLVNSRDCIDELNLSVQTLPC